MTDSLPKNTSLSAINYVEFSRSTSTGVGISSRNPQSWGALRPRPLGWAWLTHKTPLPACATPHLVVLRLKCGLKYTSQCARVPGHWDGGGGPVINPTLVVTVPNMMVVG